MASDLTRQRRERLAKMLEDLTPDQVTAVTAEIVMNNVATPDEVGAIIDDFIVTHPAPFQIMQFVLAFVLACADQGASANTALVGTNQDVRFTVLATRIKETCTLRQFCMYYSKLAWNTMLQSNRPPANWAARGYVWATRFAAFDFFTGVSEAGSLTPAGGLAREPTLEEKLAHNANREIAIQTSRVKSLHTTNGMLALRDQQDHAGSTPRLEF